MGGSGRRDWNRDSAGVLVGEVLNVELHRSPVTGM